MKIFLNVKISLKAQELKQAILNTNNLKVLRLEGNTISPEAAEELAEAIEKQKLERFIGNDIFTGRLKDEIPLALVIHLFFFDFVFCKR